jgi:RHS repeat-associated protein
MGYYLYDGGGERTLKLTGQYMALDVNGMETINGYIMNHQTLYVNPYMVVKNTEYTKHYYIENQRIVSRLGGGFLMDTVPLFSQVYGFNTLNTGNYSEKKMDDQEMVTNDLNACGQPGLVQSTAGLYAFLSAQPNLNQAENDIYYYHSDHLGSTSYVTNYNGMPSQHVDYVPFGETLLEEHLQTWQTPYKFNCKELDAESGLYYYGARYYDPRTSVFLGVDPLSDQSPNISPFAYCKNNPIVLIDPDGRSAEWVEGVDGVPYWNDKVTKTNQTDLKPGENYIGPTYTHVDEQGNTEYGAQDKQKYKSAPLSGPEIKANNSGSSTGIGATALAVVGSMATMAQGAAELTQSDALGAINKANTVIGSEKEIFKTFGKVASGAKFLGTALGVVSLADHSLKAYDSFSKGDYTNGMINVGKVGLDALFMGIRSNPVGLTISVGYGIMDASGALDYKP